MKLALSRCLLAILVSTLVLLLFSYIFPLTALLVILGIPFILFFPGFVLLAAIAARREDIDTKERIILSFVLSILLSSTIGLALNYTPFGITLNSIIITGTIFVALIAIASLIRQSRLPGDEKIILEFSLNLVKPAPGALNTTFTAIMIAVIASALASGLYFAFAQKSSEAFTQFYIVKQDGALYSPSGLTAGDEATIIVGITNHEGKQVDYRIQILVDNESYDEISPITLADGQKWQEEIVFPVESTAEESIECILFKNNESEPYLKPLRVWIGAPKTAMASER